MAKGPGRNLAKEQLWRDRLARQVRSGLTVREFCRREGLPEPSMYGWRRELARRDAERRLAANGNTRRHASVGPLLPIRVMDGMVNAAEPAASPIEVVLPSKLRILIPPSFDAEHLRRVIDTLQSTAIDGHSQLGGRSC